MKALIVSYCPRGKESRTQQLVDHAVSLLKAGKAEIEVLDIAKDVPDLLTPDRVSAYYRRNYAGEKLQERESALMAGMDRMTAQVKAADLVVVASPMYNFSQPSVVKAWFDAVMQKGQTWDIAPQGYVGLMKGKKALAIATSGGVYEGQMAGWEHCVSLSKVHFMFMGYETEAVIAMGMNMYPEKEKDILAEAQKNIGVILQRWLA